MKRWGFRTCRKAAVDSEWRTLFGSSFQVGGAVKKKRCQKSIFIVSEQVLSMSVFICIAR